jgi:hypothetical protein
MKRILICGTKPNSLGRILGQMLLKIGWNVWIFSRSACYVEDGNWHERKCDVLSKNNLQKLFAEVGQVDVICPFMDIGLIGNIETLDEDKIKEISNSMIVGSLLILQKLILTQKSKVKIIWARGKPNNKPRSLFLYSLLNSGIYGLVKEINTQYNKNIEAYLLPLGLISKSFTGKIYIDANPSDLIFDQSIDLFLESTKNIIDGKFEPGIIPINNLVL